MKTTPGQGNNRKWGKNMEVDRTSEQREETGSTPSGSPKAEVYNFTSKLWTRKANLRMRRLNHSCTQVWLNMESPDVNGIVQTGSVSNNSVLSVVVAGGKLL